MQTFAIRLKMHFESFVEEESIEEEGLVIFMYILLQEKKKIRFFDYNSSY